MFNSSTFIDPQHKDAIVAKGTVQTQDIYIMQLLLIVFQQM